MPGTSETSVGAACEKWEKRGKKKKTSWTGLYTGLGPGLFCWYVCVVLFLFFLFVFCFLEGGRGVRRSGSEWQTVAAVVSSSRSAGADAESNDSARMHIRSPSLTHPRIHAIHAQHRADGTMLAQSHRNEADGRTNGWTDGRTDRWTARQTEEVADGRRGSGGDWQLQRLTDISA